MSSKLRRLLKLWIWNRVGSGNVWEGVVVVVVMMTIPAYVGRFGLEGAFLVLNQDCSTLFFSLYACVANVNLVLVLPRSNNSGQA